MALISKMNRCAVSGSSEVVYNEAAGLYHCPVCGKDSAEPMPQADLTAVNRIAVLGDANGFFSILRFSSKKIPSNCPGSFLCKSIAENGNVPFSHPPSGHSKIL